jgi:hypothetical protein
MSKKDKSLPVPNETWACFVNIRMEVFCKALNELSITNDIFNDENEISKRLNPKLVTICREMKLKIGIPVWDTKNRPLTDNDIRSPSSNTRPDFTCYYYDTNAEANESYEINLHIECKRIGNINVSDNLNGKYITEGINRFDSIEHRYGKYANDGIMIGYIISSTKYDIQGKINEKLPNKIQKLKFTSEDKVEKISTKFIREHVKPIDFILHHVWADFTKTEYNNVELLQPVVAEVS